jgi:hypothetical protein
MRRASLLLACGFFIGATIGTGIAKQPEKPYPLSQPNDWVAFAADILQFNSAGDKSVGRFRRGSDGSTRTEIQLNYGDRIVPMIDIENLTTRRYYRFLGGDFWLTGELAYPDNAYKPRPWSSAAPGLKPYGRKLALLKGQDGSLTADTGLEAWIVANDTGTMRLLVPALNFFPVVQSPIVGRRRVYSNIEFVDSPATMFDPPPGAALKQRDSRPPLGR